MASIIPARAYIGPATDIGTNTSTSIGTTLSSTTANTKGSYVQLVSSTTRDTDYMIVNIINFPSTGDTQAIDIAVGGSGSEQVVIANLLASSHTNDVVSYKIPFSIPAGTRVSARMQSATLNDSVAINIILCAGNMEFVPYLTCDTYGFSSTTSLGTAIDPGGSTNTKGSYVQLTASTTRDHYGLAFAIDDQNVAIANTANWLFDIAVGVAASEQVVIPNLCLSSTGATTNLSPPNSNGIIPIQIPAGSRLSVRAQCTTATLALRVFGITLYGFA